MGAGLAQIGVLMVLTVIGLPLFFFGLMAALDRFEKSLSESPRTVTPVSRVAAGAVASPVSVETVVDQPDAEVVTLPTAPVSAPATASNSAAAI